MKERIFIVRVSSLIEPLFDKLVSEVIACLASFVERMVMSCTLHALYVLVVVSCLLVYCFRFGEKETKGDFYR